MSEQESTKEEGKEYFTQGELIEMINKFIDMCESQGKRSLLVAAFRAGLDQKVLEGMQVALMVFEATGSLDHE